MGGKALHSRVFLWNLAPMSHFCLYSLIFFFSNENMFSSPLQYKGKCWLTAFCDCEQAVKALIF